MVIDVNLFNQLYRITNRTADGRATRLGNNTAIFYYKTLIDDKYIMENIKKPFIEYKDDFVNYLKTIVTPISMQDVQRGLIDGDLIILYENKLFAVKGTIKREGRTVSEAIREASFEGGLETFVEQTDININLIRQYYHNDKLEIKEFEIGKNNKTTVMLLYNSEYVNNTVLQGVTNRLTDGSIPDCQSAAQLKQHLIDGMWVFPRLLHTERPDRTIFAMNKGRVILMLDGTSTAIIAPATFRDYFNTVDDRFLLPIPAIFLMILRYIAFITALVSPSLYVIIVGYNPEILRVQLAISLQGSRVGVPYASFIEVAFMLILMEFLVEASLRLPKTIGQTATTVGGLILGQGATQAGLVSDIMVIVVSAVAISNFVIPITSMNVGVRVVKYYILILTVLGGMAGFMCACLSLLYHLFSLHSFSTPYINPMNFKLHSLTAMFKRGK